jgi:hypothetical protein
LVETASEAVNRLAVAQLPPLTMQSLVYGENGRGKTTLAAVFKSARTGDPARINVGSSARNQPNVVRCDHELPRQIARPGLLEHKLRSFAPGRHSPDRVQQRRHRHRLEDHVVGASGKALLAQVNCRIRGDHDDE